MITKPFRTTYRSTQTTADALEKASKALSIPKSILIDRWVNEGLARLQQHPRQWAQF